MCMEVLASAARGCGLKTKFYACGIGQLPRIAKEFLPCGKLLLLCDESAAPQALGLRGAFAGFRVYSVVYGGERAEGLFSLPDDIRLAVAVGERSIAAARFFCTLRGAFCIAVPVCLRAESLFSPAPEGYPVAEPDAVLFDGGLAGRADEADSAAVAALSALCAEDIETDAVFSGERKDGGAGLFMKSAKLAEQGGGALFTAAALHGMALRSAVRSPSRALFELLAGKGGHSDGECALAALCYTAERRCALFKGGAPRPYFVPDYAARARRAARYIGEAAFEYIRVPTAQQSFALAHVFGESRGRFAVAAELLRAYAGRIRDIYFRAGGRKPSFGAETLEDAYSLSADLSPLISAAALERDFGTLPHMCGGAYGGKKRADG